MDVKLLFTKVIQTSRTRGFGSVLRSAVGYLRFGTKEDLIDAKYGTDTSGLVPLWRFKIASPNARHGLRYEASDQEDFEKTLYVIREDFRTFTFVDLGCGKGRGIMLASMKGFRRIIGVEFVAELRSIAQANVAKMGIVNATVLHADAAEFSFPEGDLVVYLFNPFAAEVLQKVIANLRKSFSNRRKLYVVYHNPVFAAVLDTSGFLSRFACPETARHPTLVWRSKSADDKTNR